MTQQRPSRRQVLEAGGLAAISLAATAAAQRPAPADRPAASAPARRSWRIGLPTYMFKHYNLDQTIEIARRIDVKHICLRSNLLPLNSTPDQIKAAIAKVTGAGLAIYGGGVIYMRSEQQVHRAFDHVKAAGFKLISISISPDLLGLLARKVKQHDVRAAIHNHGPEDRHWPTPVAIHEKVKRLDKRIGICHDTGHTKRAGMDAVEATLRTADRLMDVHLKDVDAPRRQGHSTELGRGVVNIPGVLRALRKIGYRDVVGIEYEKHMDDIVPGLAESVGYARGVVDTLA